MKKLLLFVCSISIFQVSFGQSEHKISPDERRLTDTLCSCVSALDMSKITTADEAIAAYTECVTKHIDLLSAVAKERNVEFTDPVAMNAIGVDLAKNMMQENCQTFIKLSVAMAKKYIDNKLNSINNEPTTTTIGVFKRIDLKGFNYVVINDENHSEKSFLWLSQFPGSEKFMNGPTQLTGKKLKITSKELEVYLPQAKGYYKLKEITAIDIL